MGLSYGSKEAVSLCNFLKGLQFENLSSVPSNCDSTGALTVAGNAAYSSRTKHTALDFFFLLELVQDGKITLHSVPTGKMLAGCGTKPLAKGPFRNIMNQIKDVDDVWGKQYPTIFRGVDIPCVSMGISQLAGRLTPPRRQSSPWTPACRVKIAFMTGAGPYTVLTCRTCPTRDEMK